MKATLFSAILLLTAGKGLLQAQPYLKGYGIPGNPSKIRATAAPTDPSNTASWVFQPDMLPHSPEAEAMVKNTALPVTLYSAMPNVSVPVYEIKTKNFDIPITLSYNYNGFKPAEVASFVGLGWSVSGGGVITRMVKGLVDHENEVVTHTDYDDYTDVSAMAARQTVLQNMNMQQMDGEPDIYVFNCNGLSGKFIMIQGKAYLFPHQDLQITGGENSGFVITSTKGDRYIFNSTERTHHKALTTADEIPDHNSAYFLSQIISADLSDTITYSYTTYTFHQPPVMSQNLSFTTALGALTNGNGQTLSTVYSSDSVHSLWLSSISTSNVTIQFNLESSPRTDIFYTDGSLYGLGSITISSPGGTALTKSVQLHHKYFNGKMSLTEADIIDNVNGAIDSSQIQRYQFQYIHPDTTATSIPGWTSMGIDYFGYYNSQNNQTLFTAQDLAASDYNLANRTPGAGCEYNLLSQITYPTGGRAVLSYTGNQTGSIDTTGQLQTNVSSQIVTVPGTDNTGDDIQATNTLQLSSAQTVHVHVGCEFVQSGEQMNATIFSLPGYLTVSPLSGTDTVYDAYISLPAGSYTYTVSADKKGCSTYADLYYTTPVVINTIAPGPGMGLQQVAFYDVFNATQPSLVKNYSYTAGVGLYQSGTTASNTEEYYSACEVPGSDSMMTTLQAGLYSPTSNLLNNTFYYSQVTETDIGQGTNGKTYYTYACHAPDDPDVFLVSRTDYAYGASGYIPLKKTVNNYSLKDILGFSTLKCTVSGVAIATEGGCAPLPTPDATECVANVLKIFAPIDGSLMSGYNILNSTIDTTWDMNGLNPMRSETDYYYDNPSYLMPTRIARNNSKGQLETTWLTYPLDYNPSGNNTPAQLDSLFHIADSSCNSSYQSCYDNLVNALQPYQPYSADSVEFSAVASEYPCETEFHTASDTVYSQRNSAWATYLSNLATAQSNDPVVFNRPVDWLQANHVLSPVIERFTTVTHSDGNQYLVAATRNDYALLANGSGQTVAMPAGIETTQLTAPVLLSGFTASKSSYYNSRAAMSYDARMRLISQNKIGDVNHCYLWGYNHQFVVAEVVGSDPATVASFINQGVLDNINTDPATMRSQLNNIRAGLAGTKALVTTCTYDPLVGMTSQTDPAGRTTYYDYDGLGRLVDVKDLNNNIVKTYHYHFMN